MRGNGDGDGIGGADAVRVWNLPLRGVHWRLLLLHVLAALDTAHSRRLAIARGVCAAGVTLGVGLGG